MSDPAIFSTRTNRTRLVVHHPDAARVLILGDGDRWTLPAVETRDHWHAEVAPLNRAASDLLGLRVTALRCLRYELDKRAKASRMIFAMESQAVSSRLPAGSRWASRSEVLAAGLGHAETQAVLESLDGARPALAPWTRAGWYANAVRWITDQLASRGIAVTGDAEQFKHWSIASILRLPTGRGDVWLKAVPPMFAHEGALLQIIGPSMPEHLPRVIATDRDRGWTLMESIPQSTIRDCDDQHAPSEASLRALARLQQAWSTRVSDLLAAGCPDRRLLTLDGALEAVLARSNVRERLDDATGARLRRFAADVPGRVDALRACGVAETLMHGDFHPGNVASDGERLIIFDWTDGCVGHPFFDLATFLPREPIERAAQLHAYLESWEPLASPAELDAAWELAEPLAYLHHAISYMRILDNIAATERWHFDADVMFWLHWLRDIVN